MKLFPTPLRIAVAGGGVAGYTAAALLSSAGASVDLFEAQTTRRAGRRHHVAGQCAARPSRRRGPRRVLDAGCGFANTGVRVPDATSRLVGEVPGTRLEPDLPSAVGIPRPHLAELLRERASAAGASVYLGAQVTAVDNQTDHVELSVQTATESSTTRYDLLVAADGINSTIRPMLGIEMTPRPMGLGVWRVLTSRPDSVYRAEVINGGTAYFAGFAPTSDTQMYAWLVDDYTDRRALSVAAQLDLVRGLAAGYHGPWDDIRSALGPDTPISYTRYSEILLPPPWHRGRTVLIGDAVHACPPTLAQGAAQALEDALVLADTLTGTGAGDDHDDALTAFATRRYPRAEAVVTGSV